MKLFRKSMKISTVVLLCMLSFVVGKFASLGHVGSDLLGTASAQSGEGEGEGEAPPETNELVVDSLLDVGPASNPALVAMANPTGLNGVALWAPQDRLDLVGALDPASADFAQICTHWLWDPADATQYVAYLTSKGSLFATGDSGLLTLGDYTSWGSLANTGTMQISVSGAMLAARDPWEQVTRAAVQVKTVQDGAGNINGEVNICTGTNMTSDPAQQNAGIKIAANGSVIVTLGGSAGSSASSSSQRNVSSSVGMRATQSASSASAPPAAPSPNGLGLSFPRPALRR